MIFLVLSILFSSALFLVFSFQKKHGIPPLLTIVVNYFTAAAVGYLGNLNALSVQTITESDWFPLSLILGTCFVVSFNLMGKTTQQMGVNVAAVASKMSMVLPVLFAVVYYKEPFGGVKMIATVLALVAVILTTRKDPEAKAKGHWALPVLLFLGCGTVDLLIGFSERTYGNSASFALIPATLFLVAGSVGLIYLLLWERSLLKLFSFRTWWFGIALGTFNYYSLHFLYLALAAKSGTGMVFTLNNIGVIALSTLLAYLCFKEKLSRINLLGIIISILSIFLMMVK